MSAPRTALRSVRAIRSRPLRQVCQRRLQSTASSAQGAGGAGGAQSAIYGGLAGGAVAFAGGYAWYSLSGTKKVVKTAKQTKDYYDSAINKAKEAAPAPNEALKWLREQASFYAGFVPGGRNFMDSVLNDLDTIHEKHADEVDKIINKTYSELKDISNKGLSVETATEAWNILQKHMNEIKDLAGDAAEDVLNNHPDIKEKVGGSFDQLKSLGDKYGPEAKKQVDETWSQVQDILKGGIGVSTADKIRKLVQEKIEQLNKLGDQAWQKGLEEAKPYLDKVPKVKELLEKNKDALRSGNLSELWDNVKQASKSGKTDKLESYVKQAVDKAKDTASKSKNNNSSKSEQGNIINNGLDQFLNVVPGGAEIIPKFEVIQELSQTKGKEAENLVRETISEIQDVLSRKAEEGQKLMEQTAKEGKQKARA